MNLNEAKQILEANGYIVETLEIDEDFGMGVGAPLGADQGIPMGGDCKAVVPCLMGMYSRNTLHKSKRKRIKKSKKKSR